MRTLLALATHLNWLVYQLMLNLLFSNGDLEEEVYISQPKDFEIKGKEDDIYRLKTHYGLKQAPRQQCFKIDSYFQETGFKRGNESTYTRREGENDFLMVCFYVDDMSYMGSNESNGAKFKVCKKFQMLNLGLLHYFLGLEVEQGVDGFFFHKRNMQWTFWKDLIWGFVKLLPHQRQ